MEELKFSLILQEKPVKIVDLDGTEKTYTLKELTGPQRELYMSTFDISMTLVDGKPQLGASSIKNFPADEFLAMCLYDESGVVVTKEKIKDWPGSVIGALHKVGLELSALDKEGQEKAKNE